MFPHIAGRGSRADQRAERPSDAFMTARSSPSFSIDSAATADRQLAESSTRTSRFDGLRLPSMPKYEIVEETREQSPASLALWKALETRKNSPQRALLASPFSTPRGYKTLLAETRRRILDSNHPRDVFADTAPLTLPHRRDQQQHVSPLPFSAPSSQRHYASAAASRVASLNRDAVGGSGCNDYSATVAATPPPPSATQQLVNEEEERRLSFEDLEAWERRVADDMMVVLFVTSVLKPALDDLLVQERDARGLILLAESHAFHDLVHCTVDGRAVLALHNVVAERKKSFLRGTKRKVEKLHDNQAAVDRLIVNYIKNQSDPHSALDEKLLELTGNATIASTYPGMLHGKSTHPQQKDSNTVRAGEAGGALHTLPSPASLLPVVLQRAKSPLPSRYAKAGISGASLSAYATSNRTIQNHNNRMVTSQVIAYVVDLLEEHDRVSRLLFMAQEEQFADIMEHFHREYQPMLEWQNRRMHLQRLQYWRSMREQDPEVQQSQSFDAQLTSAPEAQPSPGEGYVRLQSTHIVGELNASLSSVSITGPPIRRKMTSAADIASTIKEEHIQRTAIRSEEKDAALRLFAPLRSHSSQPWETCVLMVHRWNAANGFLEMYEDIRSTLSSEALLEMQQSFLPLYETLERHRVFMEVEAWHTTVARNQMAKLSQLAQYDMDSSARAAIRTIQRTVRDRNRGRFGWSWTHKVVGEQIRIYRDERVVQRGRQQLSDMQRHLEEELVAYAREIAEEHRVAREEMEIKEFQGRVQVTSNEAYERSRIRGESIQDVVEQIIWPQIVETVESEVLARHRIMVEEEETCSAGNSRFSELKRVTYRIADFLYEEPEDRAGYEADEADEFDRLKTLEYDMRELVRIAANEEERRQESARQEFMGNAIEQKVAFYTKRVQPILQRLCNESLWTAAVSFNVELPLFMQKQSTYRMYMHGRVKLIGTLMVNIHREWLNVLFKRHCFAVYGPDFEPLLNQEESNDRQEITAAEAAEYGTLEQPMQRLKWEIAMRTDRRRKAGLVIWKFYRQYKRGNVGMAGMRRAIRRYIIEPRERCATEKQRLATQNDIQDELVKLQTAEEEEIEAVARMCEDARERLQLVTEPQTRRIIAAREAMIRQIMEQNLVAVVDDFARTALDVVVEQREPYQRSRIEIQWEEEITELLYPLFQRVHMAARSSRARVIQRAWRAHLDHSRNSLQSSSSSSCALSGPAVDEILAAELRNRSFIEREEYKTVVIEVAVPFLHGATLLMYTPKDMERMLLAYMLSENTTTELSDEEWSERVRILSLMCAERARLQIRRPEKEERARITLFDAVHSVVRIDEIEEERAARAELWKERCTFLLRVLPLAEMALRKDLHSQEDAERRIAATHMPKSALDEL